jgi:hypothetical protein
MVEGQYDTFRDVAVDVQVAAGETCLNGLRMSAALSRAKAQVEGEHSSPDSAQLHPQIQHVRASRTTQTRSAQAPASWHCVGYQLNLQKLTVEGGEFLLCLFSS